jgi:hypothetical protein
MKTSAVVFVLALAASGARAQQSEASSGSAARSPSRKTANTAAAKIGGTPTHPPELGPSAEGRARAGYDIGVASATAGGRTDTGPTGDTSARRRAADRDQANIEENAPMRQAPVDADLDSALERAPARQPPSLAQPTREEILQAQRRGRIRDREVPDWIRGQQLSELDVPNPFQVEEVLKDPYRHRQDDLNP